MTARLAFRVCGVAAAITLLVSGLAPANAAPPVDGSVVLSPIEGPAGTTVEFLGQNCPQDTTVGGEVTQIRVYLDHTPPMSPLMVAVPIDADGSFSGSFVFPASRMVNGVDVPFNLGPNRVIFDCSTYTYADESMVAEFILRPTETPPEPSPVPTTTGPPPAPTPVPTTTATTPPGPTPTTTATTPPGPTPTTTATTPPSPEPTATTPAIPNPGGFRPPVTPPQDAEPIDATLPADTTSGGTFALSEAGFAPNETVTAVLYSTPIVLTSAQADGTGKVNLAITIPTTTIPGNHTLVLFSGTVVKSAKVNVKAVDVYSVPGYHDVTGRRWHTTCEPYSQTTRCRTDIWSTRVSLVDGRFVTANGWHFNNLTYQPKMKRAQWADNPLGHAGMFTSAGKKWYTECDTASTGGNGCRSYIWTSVVKATKGADGSWKYHMEQGWVFNNIVRFL